MCSAMPCRGCSPSSRRIVITNGLNPPAWILEVPTVRVGLNGSGSLHALPFGPLVTSNVELESTAPVSVHGSTAAVVVYAPHFDGVASGARSPPKKCSSKVSNGSWGVFLNVETSCPVTGFGTTSPATFTRTPEIGSSTYTYVATSDPNGFAFCSARYAEPSRGFGSSGVLIFTVPIFDASGHVGGSALCNANPSSLHACNPSAPARQIAP